MQTRLNMGCLFNTRNDIQGSSCLDNSISKEQEMKFVKSV